MTNPPSPDWARIRADVGMKLGWLEAAWKGTERDSPPELHAKLVADLYRPALNCLARFCACIQEEQSGEEGANR